MVSSFSLVASNPFQGAQLLSGDPKSGVSTWLTRDGRTITKDATTPWYGDLMKAITSAALAAGAGVGGAAALGGGAGGAAGAGGLGGTGALGGVPAAGTGALSAAAPTAASIVPAAGSGLSLGGLMPTLPTLGPVLGSTTLGTMGTGALYGAGTGALGAAVTGGKPLKGALYGGLGGAALGGLASAFPETAASLGIGPSSSLPTSMPGSSGGGYATNTLDENGNVIPLATSGDGSSGGGALGSIFGGGGGGKGLSWLDLGAGVLGALGSRPPKPNYGMAPGPSTTAATRGPLFDKPLPSAGAYLNRTPVQNYQPIGNDWYTWGEHAGQPQFYNNNRLTSPNMARGGALSRSMARGGDSHGYVEGEGDGMQDAIPAKLSDGEFVFNADVVSRMGNGSNRKGAQRLEHMRRAVMRDSGIPRVVPKKIRKSPLQYLQEAKGKRR